MGYNVLNLTGDYSKREYDANTLGAAMVWHQHFNSFNETTSYAMVEIAEPVTDREMQVALEVAAAYNTLLGGGLGDGDGMRILKGGERAEYIIDGNKEAYISEPAFVSNPTQAAWLLVPENLRKIAEINVEAIKRHYPDGSTIALSIGHKYKTTAPNDRGAAVYGSNVTEADLNEQVITWMVEMLQNSEATPAPAPAPATTPLLKLGSRGDDVKRLQVALNARGAVLVADGIFGRNTEEAVKAFQRNGGLVADGIVGTKTWAALATPVPAPAPTPKPTIRKGDRGDAVKLLQIVLRDSFHYPLVPDGIFGTQTDGAVRSFQRRRGLVADGIVGARTWAALGF